MFKSYSMELGGRTLTLEFGKYAEQASGSCFVRYGDTCVLTTCTVAKTPRPGIDFFPLSVDFEEKLYSVGHIPGSWNRREGRPAEKAILTSRLIDRPLRPLFPKGHAPRRVRGGHRHVRGHQQHPRHPGDDRRFGLSGHQRDPRGPAPSAR